MLRRKLCVGSTRAYFAASRTLRCEDGQNKRGYCVLLADIHPGPTANMKLLALITLMASLQIAHADFTTKQPTVGPEFGFVLVVVACICMQCTMTIFGTASARYKHLSVDFVKKSLQAENGMSTPP
eukprot:500277-Rhodomonas_salina.2